MNRRAPVFALALPLAVSCYQTKALDTRAVMNEVANETRGARAGAGAAKGSAPGALSEDEAVALALRSNPDLRAARKQKDVAEGQIVAAGALSNPTVSFDVIHLEDWGTRDAWAIALGWEPPQPGVYSARKAGARAQSAATTSDIAEAQWQLTVAVRGAHAALLALGEQRALVDKALVGRRQISTLVERRMGGGASTRLDLGLAQLAVSELERQRDELAAQQVAASAQLGALLGTPPPGGVTGTLSEDPSGPPALEPLVDAALDARPALAAEEKRYAAREEAVRLEHAQRWPWFRLTAIPRYRSDGSDVHPHDFGLGVELTLPIFNQNAGLIQVAEAQRDQERELYRKQVVGLRLDLDSARAQLELRGATLRRYQTQVLPGLDAQEHLLATAVAGGQLDVVALLRASDAILGSRREYIDLRLACYGARLALDRAVGRRVGADAPPPTKAP